jgi:hypothetical protein
MVMDHTCGEESVVEGALPGRDSGIGSLMCGIVLDLILTGNVKPECGMECETEC